ncbi:hypothetical protein [Marinococcus luteus]|uniref:hypothetical protein n=1 Tax=Marinococcus luteus TaxID=1122204 RepID=UPI002ACDFD63|nr:hypothetical protein [Marinococcus luteus]
MGEILPAMGGFVPLCVYHHQGRSPPMSTVLIIIVYGLFCWTIIADPGRWQRQK